MNFWFWIRRGESLAILVDLQTNVDQYWELIMSTLLQPVIVDEYSDLRDICFLQCQQYSLECIIMKIKECFLRLSTSSQHCNLAYCIDQPLISFQADFSSACVNLFRSSEFWGNILQLIDFTKPDSTSMVTKCWVEKMGFFDKLQSLFMVSHFHLTLS